MPRFFAFAALAFVGVLMVGVAAAQSVDIVESALRDELGRSMRDLRLGQLDRPYFLSYRVDDVRTVSVEGSLGSLLASDENHRRYLSVELRVGDYAFDNTNFFSLSAFSSSQIVQSFGGTTPLPLEDDYREIRRQVWLATDLAYKNALEDLAKKKAALQNKTRTEVLPDFTRVEPREIRGEDTAIDLGRARGEKLARDLSKLFLEMPHVATSAVNYSASHVHSRYLNSEGSFFSRSISDVVLVAKAALQAEDGQWIQDACAAFGRRPEDLLDPRQMADRVRDMGDLLGQLQGAEQIERYNGPVLFEAEAAAELLAQVFAPRLLARRRSISGDDLGMMSAGNDFQDRLGARVLPRFMNVIDDATAVEVAGQPVYGGYAVDDEAVPGQTTRLVTRGFLKTLLADRTPVVGIEHASGNRRSGGVAPSNLVFRVDQGGLSAAELKRELLVWAADRGAEYGVIVRKLSHPFFRVLSGSFPGRMSFGGGDVAVSPVVAAYKVYPDGREVLLRHVEIPGMSVRSFREVVAAGAQLEVFHRPFQPATGNPLGGFSQQVPLISLATPALLFEELTLKKPSGEIPQLPALPHPLAREP